MKKIFKTEEDFINFSKGFFIPLPISKVILLNGELGVGKTTFLKGLALNLGIDYFSSPTYTIINKYKFSSFDFYHMDLYRLSFIEEFELIGGKDIIFQYDSIIAIEWPEIISSIIPKNRSIILNFSIDKNSYRFLEIEYNCN